MGMRCPSVADPLGGVAGVSADRELTPVRWTVARFCPLGREDSSPYWMKGFLPVPMMYSPQFRERAVSLALDEGRKHNIELTAKKKSELQAEINNGTITSNDLPGKIQKEFPGEFKGKTLNDIKKERGIK